MRPLQTTTLGAVMLASSCLASCESRQELAADPPIIVDDRRPSAKEPSPAQAPSKPTEGIETTPQPTPSSSRERTEPPLPAALNAPEDAITSAGRFASWMERGLDDYMPRYGIIYGRAGVGQDTLRVAIAADGTGRWARGRAALWEPLGRPQTFSLDEHQTRALAELISAAWVAREDYPPSTVEQTRLLILRDADTARVFEHSALPESLAPLEQMLVNLTQD